MALDIIRDLLHKQIQIWIDRKMGEAPMGSDFPFLNLILQLGTLALIGFILHRAIKIPGSNLLKIVGICLIAAITVLLVGSNFRLIYNTMGLEIPSIFFSIIIIAILVYR